MNWDEVSKVKEFLAEVGDDIGDLTNEKPEVIMEKIKGLKKYSKESDQLTANIIKRCYELTQEQLNELEYPDAVKLYSHVWIESTEIKKKSVTQSDLPTTPITSTSQQSSESQSQSTQ